MGIGITNQRETTIAWNSVTGHPLYSAIGEIIPVCNTQILLINTLLNKLGIPGTTKYFYNVHFIGMLH